MMKKLYGYDRNMSKDEYIIDELMRHNSTTCITGLTKEEMYDLLDNNNVKYRKSELKSSLFEKVMNLPDITLDDLASMKGIGVKARDYMETFGITRSDVSRLERFGKLKVVCVETVYKYNKTLHVPVYDIKQFDEMTEDGMNHLMIQFPKGKRREKI